MSLSNSSGASIGYTGTNVSFAVNYSLEFQLSGLMNAMAYGAVAILFVNMIHTLFVRWSESMRSRMPYETVVLVLALFVLNTLYSATTILYMESTYIYNVAYPFGIPLFTITLLPTPVGILNQVSFVLGTLLADVFLLARARVILRAAQNRRLYLCLVPAVTLFLSSIVLAVILSLDLILPDGVFNNAQINWSSIYSVVSLTENLYLTLCIALQIWIYRRRNASQEARMRYPGHNLYSHLLTIFIESAALYFVVALGVVATYNSPSNLVWQSIWLPMQTIGSFLITYRIARNGSWETETSVGLRDNDGVLDIRSSPLTSSSREMGDHEETGAQAYILGPATSSYPTEKC